MQILYEVRATEWQSARLALAHAATALEAARAVRARATSWVRRIESAINDQRIAPPPLDRTEAQHIEEYLAALECELLDARDAAQAGQIALHEAEQVLAEYADDLRRCDIALRAVEVAMAAGEESQQRAAVADAEVEEEEVAIAQWTRRH